MFSEYRFVEVSNSMTFRPPQIHSLFFPASDFEKISKFSKPNHFYVVSNRVEVKRIFRFYRNMDEDFSNKKFLWAVCGAGFFVIVQCFSLGLIWLIRHVGKFNTGKVFLFFLLFGIITAILLAGICIAAF